MQRWRSLRDRYVRSVSLRYKASGSAAPESTKPWPFMEMLEFLGDHVRPRKTSSNVPMNTSVEGTSVQDYPASNQPNGGLEEDDTTLLSPPEVTTVSSELSSIVFEESSASSSRKKAKSTKKEKCLAYEKACEEFSSSCQELRTVFQKRFIHPAEIDEDKPFLDQVALYLKKVSREQKEDLKMKVLQYIHNECKNIHLSQVILPRTLML